MQDANTAMAQVRRSGLLRAGALIGGQWNDAGTRFAVRDPASGAEVAQVMGAGADDTRAAIAAAAAALPGWRGLLPQARAAVLRRWFDLIVASADDLALLMTVEQGKPLAEARGEIAYAASFVEWYAEEARRLTAEGVASHLADAEMIVRREPIGVVGVVTPWNFPAAMLTRKAAAALAAGCTVVAHPSSMTPLSALALGVLAERAGVPPGVFNLLPGQAAPIVDVLCDDPRVRGLSFTGSTEIGQRIAARAAAGMKRLVMELGGHAPLIVFDDADPGRATDIAMDAKFATSGQDCLAANRIYVQRGIYPAFLDAFADRIRALRVGPGLDPATQIGPLMHDRALAKVAAHVDDAVTRGARLLAGGSQHNAGPLFWQPTLLVDVPDGAAILREETFGPVAAVQPFATEAEVVARANDTDFGLVAYVVTRDGARQLRMSRALGYGMVAVNRVKITGAPIPFGGTKLSGLGREGGRHGIEAFTDLKYICLDMG